MSKCLSLLRDFKKMILINIIKFFALFIYCLPEEINIEISSVLRFVFLSAAMFSLIFQTKLNIFTGFSHVFMRGKGNLLKFSPFFISIPMAFVGIVCLVKLLITRSFEYEIYIFASVIALHASLKSYDLYTKEE
ncbi:MAG: hypothetical protein RR945_10340 [Erysipelotrichaceae bacterium]